jgi:hypothetical protein
MKFSSYFVFNHCVLLCPNLYSVNLRNSLRTRCILILVPPTSEPSWTLFHDSFVSLTQGFSAMTSSCTLLYSLSLLLAYCTPLAYHYTLAAVMFHLKSKSKLHCDWRSVSQSVSLGVKPHLGLMTRYFFCSEYGIRLTVTFFIPWYALSDERTGLSFVCAAGLCQRSLSRS